MYGCTSALGNRTESVQKMIDHKRPICKFCKTDVKSKEKVCERCAKNYKEHGKPKVCVYCKLHSAFIGSKCQRCSSSQKKYGTPVECSKCKSKSAFDHEKARMNGSLVCWLCFVTIQRKSKQTKRKLEKNDEGGEKMMKYSSTTQNKTNEENTWKEIVSDEKPVKKSKEVENLRRQAHFNSSRNKASGQYSLEERLATMKKTFSAPSSPTSPARIQEQRSSHSTPKSDTEVSSMNEKQSGEWRWNGSNLSGALLPTIADQNIVTLTKLRDEVASLKKQLAKKDQMLIEKDKQLSLVKVNHLTEMKEVRAKFKSQEEEYIKNLENFRNKNQGLLKKIAQLSKGKA